MVAFAFAFAFALRFAGWVDMHHPETMVDCLVADPSDHE
jgi:hypothetical protein